MPFPASSGLLCLLAAIALYAVKGVPTPDRLGGLEWALAGLLFIAVLFARPWAILRPQPHEAPWLGWGRAALVLGLSIPAVVGLASAHDGGAILRDGIAMVFIMMPVLFARMRPEPHLLAGAVVALGVCMSLRALGYAAGGLLRPAASLDYLAILPSVLCASIACIGLSFSLFCKRFSPQIILLCVVLAALGCICVLPLAQTAQRASLGAWVMAFMLLCVEQINQRPRRALCALALSGGAALVFIQIGGDVLEMLMSKQRLVGANMRFEELQAVWTQVAANPLSLLFGKGWGAHYASPAVAGISVNYTHSLFSALLLKAGIVGVFWGLGLVAALLYSVWRAQHVDLVWKLALGLPLLIDVFIYASYKSFDFGILLLLAAWMAQPLSATQAIATQRDAL